MIVWWRIRAVRITPPSVWRVSIANQQLLMIIKDCPLFFCRWFLLVRCPFACVISRCWKVMKVMTCRSLCLKSAVAW
jgi:hypothetical protein